MEDFNTLTPYICDKWAKTLETPFVAFGGSYGANMAMWLQLKKSKYNGWSHCLICTTAQTFPSRDQQVCQDWNRSLHQCVVRVSQLVCTGWEKLFKHSLTKKGCLLVAQILGLCHPLPDTHATNKVHGWICLALETMVQYGYIYTTQFYNPVHADPFKVACEGMRFANTGLGALQIASNIYLNYTGQAGNCYDFESLVQREASLYLRQKGQ